MSAVTWYLRRWARTLRWQGLAGIALAAAAVALHVSGIEPGKARIDRLKQEALSVRDFARQSPDAAGSGDEAWLQHFYRLLPAKASAPEWLKIIFAAADGHSVGLERGDYRMSVDRSGRLIAYEIGLPVRGTYVQIRQFIAEVLDRIPAVALDEFTVKRETIGDPRIDASIRFTLFLNGG
jgi:hypothetical protein